MTIHQSEIAKGKIPQPYPAHAGVVCAIRASFMVPTNIVEGDIIELLALPLGCVPVDVIFDSDDLDTGSAAIVWDVGIMSGAYGDTESVRTCGDEFFDGITTSQAGGVARTTERDGLRVAKSGTNRGIGAKLVTDAATAQAGEIGLTLFYVAS